MHVIEIRDSELMQTMAERLAELGVKQGAIVSLIGGADRQPLVAAALLAGVAPTEVAAALGLDIAELQVAVPRWAKRLRLDGYLTADACHAIVAAVFQPDG